MTVKKFTWTECIVRKVEGKRWNSVAGQINSIRKRNEIEIKICKELREAVI